jgi:F-type H+-transporting ATPase subunit a
MRLSPDEIIFWQHGFVKLNATVVFTWVLMLVLTVGSILVTRKLSRDMQRSRWQNLLEIVVTGIEKQIEEVGLPQPRKYLGFLGTLFLFVAAASLSTIIPGYEPPTGSLSTTAALALCVFVAVPLFGIEEQGIGNYLKSYMQPTFIMLPFNIISEVSRTLALAVRLFGNMMSGTMIIGRPPGSVNPNLRMKKKFKSNERRSHGQHDNYRGDINLYGRHHNRFRHHGTGTRRRQGCLDRPQRAGPAA